MGAFYTRDGLVYKSERRLVLLVVFVAYSILFYVLNLVMGDGWLYRFLWFICTVFLLYVAIEEGRRVYVWRDRLEVYSDFGFKRVIGIERVRYIREGRDMWGRVLELGYEGRGRLRRLRIPYPRYREEVERLRLFFRDLGVLVDL